MQLSGLQLEVRWGLSWDANLYTLMEWTATWMEVTQVFQNLHLIGILFLSHLNPGQKNIISPPSMYHLTFIQVHRFSFHIHPGCVWIPSRPPRLTSHIHPGCVSPQSRSRYLHLTSIKVTSYFYPDPENCISSPPRFHLKPILVLISTPSMVSLTYNDVQKRLVSPTSMYQLTTFPVQCLLSI